MKDLLEAARIYNRVSSYLYLLRKQLGKLEEYEITMYNRGTKCQWTEFEYELFGIDRIKLKYKDLCTKIWGSSEVMWNSGSSVTVQPRTDIPVSWTIKKLSRSDVFWRWYDKQINITTYGDRRESYYRSLVWKHVANGKWMRKNENHT